MRRGRPLQHELLRERERLLEHRHALVQRFEEVDLGLRVSGGQDADKWLRFHGDANDPVAGCAWRVDVHARVRDDVHGEREAVARRDAGVAGIGRDVDVRAADLRGGHRRGASVQSQEDVRERRALDVVVLEEAGHHLALRIEDEGAGEGDPDPRRIGPPAGDVLLQFRNDRGVVLVRSKCHLRHGVQDAEGLDGGRPDVGEKRKGDLLARGELRQCGHRVVTDRRHPQPLCAQFTEPTLQVD